MRPYRRIGAHMLIHAIGDARFDNEEGQEAWAWLRNERGILSVHVCCDAARMDYGVVMEGLDRIGPVELWDRMLERWGFDRAA
jgi:hypothetical protein